ncbi:MAG: FAD-dependent oxidoreductase [Deltaproteobacteria bacterium]|jgi:protoporphyrinogen oxidase|nr:FAD-dependent oxidoreductase [Deltaproteobacteria bacterium]
MSGAGRSWAIVGGGLLGGTLALRLAEAGQEVTLFEAASELGGLAAAWQLGDLVWDRHYHVTLLSDGHTRGLLRSLDLEAEMQWVKTRTSLYAERQLLPMSNAIDYLRLPTLGWIDKARLAGTILWASRVRDGAALDEIPVEGWLEQLSGKSVLEKLWVPLLRSKLGDRYPEASAAFLWATIQRLYAARRSGLKEEMFGYVPGGYARILARLSERLEAAGVAVRTGAPAREIREREGRWRLGFGEAKEEAFDRAVVTLTPRRTARLLPDSSTETRAALGELGYQGIVCASVLLDRPVADSYLTYLVDRELPFTAIVEMSAFVDPSELGGRGLVYLPLYLHESDERFHAPDEEIRASFLAGLQKVHLEVTEDRVQAFRISRVAEVFPFPVQGYARRLPPGRLGHGLHWVSSAQIAGGTLNVNDTVAVAEAAAASLIASGGLEAAPGASS